MTWRIATFEPHEWRGCISRRRKTKGTVGVGGGSGGGDRRTEGKRDRGRHLAETEGGWYVEINVMGEAGDEGQAEKGRRERQRQKACLLIWVRLSLPSSPCTLRRRARHNFWRCVFVRQVGSGAKREPFGQVEGSIPNRCLSGWSLHVVPAVVVQA